MFRNLFIWYWLGTFPLLDTIAVVVFVVVDIYSWPYFVVWLVSMWMFALEKGKEVTLKKLFSLLIMLIYMNATYLMMSYWRQQQKQQQQQHILLIIRAYSIIFVIWLVGLHLVLFHFLKPCRGLGTAVPTNNKKKKTSQCPQTMLWRYLISAKCIGFGGV